MHGVSCKFGDQNARNDNFQHYLLLNTAYLSASLSANQIYGVKRDQRIGACLPQYPVVRRRTLLMRPGGFDTIGYAKGRDRIVAECGRLLSA